jgi:hypothetical protein
MDYPAQVAAARVKPFPVDVAEVVSLSDRSNRVEISATNHHIDISCQSRREWINVVDVQKSGYPTHDPIFDFSLSQR